MFISRLRAVQKSVRGGQSPKLEVLGERRAFCCELCVCGVWENWMGFSGRAGSMKGRMGCHRKAMRSPQSCQIAPLLWRGNKQGQMGISSLGSSHSLCDLGLLPNCAEAVSSCGSVTNEGTFFTGWLWRPEWGNICKGLKAVPGTGSVLSEHLSNKIRQNVVTALAVGGNKSHIQSKTSRHLNAQQVQGGLQWVPSPRLWFGEMEAMKGVSNLWEENTLLYIKEPTNKNQL